jgi:uncharacterized protein (TIGR02646 family)
MKHWKEHTRADNTPKVWQESKPSEIWNELKMLFLHKVFNEKCAYCEGKYGAGHPWHVEHFRPKSEVTEYRKLINHPGYFWLAYEWHNLLLSCGHSNTYEERTAKTGGKSHPSKSNEFRVRGPRLTGPGPDPVCWREELKKERPLLLNPYDEDADPEDHLTFEETGEIRGITDEGRETVEVCNLKRPALAEAHRRAQPRAYQKVNIQLGRADAGEPPPDRYFGPEEEYSAWLNYWAAVLVKRLSARSAQQTGPPPNPGPLPASAVLEWPKSIHGQYMAALAALDQHPGGLTPDQLAHCYGARKNVRIDSLLAALVRDGEVRPAGGTTFVLV